MDILEVVEKSDGSAEISLDIDRNGLDLLVKEGFISMMNFLIEPSCCFILM